MPYMGIEKRGETIREYEDSVFIYFVNKTYKNLQI